MSSHTKFIGSFVLPLGRECDLTTEQILYNMPGFSLITCLASYVLDTESCLRTKFPSGLTECGRFQQERSMKRKLGCLVGYRSQGYFCRYVHIIVEPRLHTIDGEIETEN